MKSRTVAETAFRVSVTFKNGLGHISWREPLYDSYLALQVIWDSFRIEFGIGATGGPGQHIRGY